jgi:hypothetical protein
MKLEIIALASLAGLSIPSVQAGPTTYACTVQFALAVGDDGVPEQAGAISAKPGTRFIVDRTTGRFHGVEMFDNEGGDNVILAAGNSQMSFRLLSVVGLRTNYLEVQEFMPGPRKPFLMVDYGDLYTGLCD